MLIDMLEIGDRLESRPIIQDWISNVVLVYEEVSGG